MQQIHFGNLMAPPKAWPEGGDDIVVVCLMSPRQVIEFASGLKINKEPFISFSGFECRKRFVGYSRFIGDGLTLITNLGKWR